MRTLSSYVPVSLINRSLSSAIPVLVDEAAGQSFTSAPPRMQVPPRTPKARAAVNPIKTIATHNGAAVLRLGLSITQPNHDHIARTNKLAARL